MHQKIIILLGGLLLITAACKKDPKPTSERIRKVWTISIARENGTVVYDAAKTTQVSPAYASFKLDLSTTTQAVLTDIDNRPCSGSWTMEGDDNLTLQNLAPAPTGSSGTIAFKVSAFTDNSMTLTRTTTNAKTGGTLNAYDLVSP